MKKCPYCAEEIQDEAKKCKHCGSFLQKGQGVESSKPQIMQSSRNTSKGWIILFFIVIVVILICSMFSKTELTKEDMDRIKAYPLVYNSDNGPAMAGTLDDIMRDGSKVERSGSTLTVTRKTGEVVTCNLQEPKDGVSGVCVMNIQFKQ